ncbi:hypothetical protein [Neptuniibacter sp.]|uniref:hypothetical protein n=1 Tax=Neptuniibacter sp. TaxID=1962643 RepID=UPI0026087BD4|nr:hypothetical protein [Neptuniibacter sp.]MCP4595599.1 hypothetical protein [Neptuniibacter sp.]
MKYLTLLLFLFPTFLQAEETPTKEPKIYRVIDNSYTVCTTKENYDQLLKWSLYGVGQPPQSGCLPAPANAKAIIKQCPEGDIIVCQFQLIPEDGSPAFDAWASKVMLRPDK